MARRSVLFSPGDDLDKLRKAPESDADVVVFDLEDSVVPDAKPVARETVRDALGELLPTACEVCVRVNPVGAGAAQDIAVALDRGAPDSVMLPKTSTGDEVRELTTLLADAGYDLPVLALIETAAGVLHAEGIAAADATDAVIFGAEDLAGDIGAVRTDEGTELAYARQYIVLAARTANVTPIDTLYPAFRDHAGLRRDAERAVELGYDGKIAIHPDQATVINGVFTPTDERIAWARQILDAREAADGGVFVVNGKMIDAPQVKQAERVIERARAESDDK